MNNQIVTELVIDARRGSATPGAMEFDAANDRAQAAIKRSTRNLRRRLSRLAENADPVLAAIKRLERARKRYGLPPLPRTK